jgi:hypothetical protein
VIIRFSPSLFLSIRPLKRQRPTAP